MSETPCSLCDQFLKSLVQTDNPPNIDTLIADGRFLGKSTHRLKQANYCSDDCFEVYKSPSVKDGARQVRVDDQFERKFSIESQEKMPSDPSLILIRLGFLRIVFSEGEGGGQFDHHLSPTFPSCFMKN